MRWNLNKLLATALVAFALAGCTSDEEKITRVIEKELEECKNAEGTFHEVVLFDDSKVELLKAACSEPIGEIERLDDFRARTTTGPYIWLFGVDEESGIWMLSGLSWDDFERGKRDATAQETTADVLQDGIDLLSKAQEEWNKSAWVVETKLDTALRIREKKRGKAEDTTGLGEQATKILAEATAWAKENDKPEVAAKAELMVASYFKKQRDKLISAMDNFGGQDEWLENLIDQAKKDKNKQDEKDYTEQLEKSRAERPAQKQQVRRKIFTVTKNLCDHLAAIDSKIGGETGDQVSAMTNQVDCSTEGLAELEAQIEAPDEATAQ